MRPFKTGVWCLGLMLSIGSGTVQAYDGWGWGGMGWGGAYGGGPVQMWWTPGSATWSGPHGTYSWGWTGPGVARWSYGPTYGATSGALYGPARSSVTYQVTPGYLGPAYVVPAPQIYVAPAPEFGPLPVKPVRPPKPAPTQAVRPAQTVPAEPPAPRSVRPAQVVPPAGEPRPVEPRDTSDELPQPPTARGRSF